MSRAELYGLVWADSMPKLAAQLGMSIDQLERICRMCLVPYPNPGHWRELAAGSAPAKPPLVKLRTANEIDWPNGSTIDATRLSGKGGEVAYLRGQQGSKGGKRVSSGWSVVSSQREKDLSAFFPRRAGVKGDQS